MGRVLPLVQAPGWHGHDAARAATDEELHRGKELEKCGGLATASVVRQQHERALCIGRFFDRLALVQVRNERLTVRIMRCKNSRNPLDPLLQNLNVPHGLLVCLARGRMAL